MLTVYFSFGWQAGFILTLSDLMKEDIQSIFSKAMLPRWVVSSDLEKVSKAWLKTAPS